MLFSILFWSVFATVYACVEIEIEGKWGWAEKLPTWYRTTGPAARLYGLAMGGRPLTGYHAFMFILPVLIFHVPFAMGMPWTARGENKAWAMYFVWLVLWDYHWFVLNPHYEGRFRKTSVWWHAKGRWIAGLFPVVYLAGVALSLFFAWLGGDGLLAEQGKILLGFATYTSMLHLLAPSYADWYWQMRARDDRDKANIFHE